MASFAVRIRDRKSGKERALPVQFFGGFTSRAEAEVSRSWYHEMSSASARQLVEAFIVEELLVVPTVRELGELVPA